jgi:hypothetical protein
MPRSDITGKGIDLITDDGAVLASIAKGEQLRLSFTLSWVTDLTGYTISATVKEGNNVAGTGNTPPTEEAPSATTTALTIIDATVSDNAFQVVLPADLCNAWDVQPAPDDPVYGFFALKVADTGASTAQQIFVPVRGLVEIRYNPAV